MRRLALALCALLAAAPAAAPVAAQEFEGRAYALTQGSGAGPLILALHGGLGSGPQLRRDSPIDPAAARIGATVAWPSAPDRAWNDGRFGPGGARDRTGRAQRDDAGHLLRLAAQLQRGLADRRLFVIGHSNGGGMAMRLACLHPERLAGIAIVATKALAGVDCPNPAPVPTILFHGTADPLSPHDGNRTPRQVARTGAILSSDATLALLARHNRCTGPVRSTTLPRLPGSGITPRIDDATGCAAPLRRVVLSGGGHGFPGAPAFGRLRMGRIGPATPDYDAAAAAFAFWGLAPDRR